MGYDIIGDVHGHADRLTSLLTHMGYRRRSGAWRHSARRAIFVGDLIDQGPAQTETLHIVRAMCDAGSAEAVMGNHEFNAISWATPDDYSDGRYLRERQGALGERNRKQHAAFLAEVGDDTLAHREWTDWFRTMPLWVEKSGFRVVHACWDPRRATDLKQLLAPGNRLTPRLLRQANCIGTAAFRAIDVMLKGPEARLPAGGSITDHSGNQRSSIRLRWWSGARTFRGAYIGPPGFEIPDDPLPPADVVPVSDLFTFIGHYWFDWARPPTPASPRVVCVDYSAARGGPLVAYRADGETTLTPSRFCWVAGPAGTFRSGVPRAARGVR